MPVLSFLFWTEGCGGDAGAGMRRLFLIPARMRMSWTNADKNCVLIGDSCHPMLPYLAQGANSSLEDAAVLGRLLSYVNTKEQLPQAITLYEGLRKPRSEKIVRETFRQRHDFHMPDGEEQELRDAVFASQLGKPISCNGFPSRW